MNALWIGDMHLKLTDLQDQITILDQISSLVKRERPDYVILSGDQFDTFGVIRSEILAAWSKFFLEIGSVTKVIALVGNHDLSGADGGVSSMEAFKSYPNVLIVDKETAIPELGIALTPFIRDTAEFERSCRAIPRGYALFCHQSFNGATFENGFYDPHGADPECVKHLKTVISGHVHKAQSFQNIIYPGTPRQLTFADAGEKKAVFTISLTAPSPDKQSYNIEKAHVLDVPTFEVIEADNVDELLAKISADQRDFSKTHVKLSTKGTPSEIAAFWQNPQVVEFKSKAKRVVDALTSMKPITAFISVKGQTQSEKLNEYIKQRQWRTEADQLAERARQYLTS